MLTPSPNHFSQADAGGNAVEIFALARGLYDRLSGGHDGLGFNVRGVPSVSAVGADGKRRPVLLGYGQGEADDTGREWRPARELVQVGGDRRLVARVLTPQAIAAHVRGGYAVAFEAAGWVEWVAVDIDAHADPADGDDGARLAQERARRVLGQVLAALGCGGERWPVILRSPGGGFHLWIPITRGGGVGADHRWPARWAGEWFRHHLASAGVELRDGVCEVYPSGRRLRAPCGRGSVLLRVVGDVATDPYALVPWAGTVSTRARWVSHGDVLTVRRVGPMLRALLAEWDRQRRTIADWLGRPEAAWDPDWGFLGRRGEKKQGPAFPGTYSRSQQIDDVSDPSPGAGPGRGRGRPALVVIAGGGGDRGSLLGLPASFSKTPVGAELASDAGEVEGGPVSSMLVKGSAFWRKVHRLLSEGVTEAGTRHDAVLTLCFAWGAAAGLSDDETIERLIAWCGAHAHAGSKLAGPRFTAECVREAAHYLRTYGPRWPFRGAGRGSAVALGVLVEADRRVLELVDARVRTEAAAVLSFLAGKADDGGTVADPVEWAARLAARLLGDRRVVDGDQRRRAAVMAVEELARLGVITRHSGHAVGRHGRRWSVWYRFGSGELPALVTVDRASWERAGRREVLVPSLAMAAPTIAPVIVEAAQDAPGGAEASAVEVREVGAREVREGVLRALSAEGGPVRLVLVPSDAAPAPARPGYRAAWWVRQWRGAPTVGGFASAHEGAIMVGPRLAAVAGVARLVARGGELVAAVPVPVAGSYDPPSAVPVEVAELARAEVARGPQGAGGAVELYAGPREAAPARAAVPAELRAVLGEVAPDLAGALAGGWAAWEARQKKDPGV
jgi:hypothetical protein